MGLFNLRVQTSSTQQTTIKVNAPTVEKAAKATDKRVLGSSQSPKK